MTINERLKALRLESGLTQAQLAKELDIAQTTIAAYEKAHDPNIYNLIAYARYFKCSVDFLAGVEESGYTDSLLFSKAERTIIKDFRRLSPAAKKCALAQIAALADSGLNG